LNLISGTFIIETKRLQWLTPYTSGGVSVIDVRDVAHAHLAAAEKGRTGERYILTAANYPNRVWMAMIAKAVGVSAPRLMMPDFVLEPVAKVVDKLKRHGLELPVDAHQVRLGSRNLFFNASKMYRELGRPQISMPQSLDDTYEWYLTHGYIQPDILSGLIGMVGKWLNWS
jgi:dihydroflavonol-4-reductase